jgi:catechol 2,3-dioxygenase-like lactoylglutathione lyase family enzyme
MHVQEVKMVKFKMSSNIAVRHQDYANAVEFYSDVLGFENRSTDPNLADFDADPINLYVLEDDKIEGPVLELFVSDLEKAREFLLENGCKVLRWRGKGQDCYIQDPFGVRYNLWEE